MSESGTFMHRYSTYNKYEIMITRKPVVTHKPFGKDFVNNSEKEVMLAAWMIEEASRSEHKTFQSWILNLYM